MGLVTAGATLCDHFFRVRSRRRKVVVALGADRFFALLEHAQDVAGVGVVADEASVLEGGVDLCTARPRIVVTLEAELRQRGGQVLFVGTAVGSMAVGAGLGGLVQRLARTELGHVVALPTERSLVRPEHGPVLGRVGVVTGFAPLLEGRVDVGVIGDLFVALGTLLAELAPGQTPAHGAVRIMAPDALCQLLSVSCGEDLLVTTVPVSWFG
jgi:hypothetical protein